MILREIRTSICDAFDILREIRGNTKEFEVRGVSDWGVWSI